MTESIPPGLILIAGALLLPLLRGRVQAAWTVILPLLSLLQLLTDYARVLAHGRRSPLDFPAGRLHDLDWPASPNASH